MAIFNYKKYPFRHMRGACFMTGRPYLRRAHVFLIRVPEVVFRPLVQPSSSAGFAAEVGIAAEYDAPSQYDFSHKSLALELRAREAVYYRQDVVRAALGARGFFKHGHT